MTEPALNAECVSEGVAENDDVMCEPAPAIVDQSGMTCPRCGSEAWLSHAFDLGRAYCLDCDHEWERGPLGPQPSSQAGLWPEEAVS